METKLRALTLLKINEASCINEVVSNRDDLRCEREKVDQEVRCRVPSVTATDLILLIANSRPSRRR